MKYNMICVAIGALLLVPASAAFGASTGTQGQPNQTCGVTTGPATPGNSASAQGSAFNSGGVAPSVYAGTQRQIDKSGGNASPNAVAQYDVACFQVNQKQVP